MLISLIEYCGAEMILRHRSQVCEFPSLTLVLSPSFAVSYWFIIQEIDHMTYANTVYDLRVLCLQIKQIEVGFATKYCADVVRLVHVLLWCTF